MTDPVSRRRLTEALATRSWLTEIGEPPNMRTAGDIRTEAAEAVLSAPTARLCMKHACIAEGDFCEVEAEWGSARAANCQIVESVALVPLEDE